ncbi:docking protein 1b isoform X2 [Scleropages formosus]|uniref:docking protein 1b isoform X2 n=1 Tax=Scleropages formosus TaxID=113540 RepID=UPI0008790C72|nr:docking protein 1 isoform X2 [Scleropages formosus]
MDAHVKEGLLYVQHQKFGKKWKKSWFVLYPASQNGIARLEFFDCNNASEKPNTKKLDKKIIRLAECISIWPAVTETCPKENMSAFCVETNDKTHVFAAEKQTSAEWVEKMCELAFQGGSGSGSNGQQELKMAENLIYYSREEVNEFWVCVQRTEASERCGLQGSYWLKADSDSLVLKEPKTKRNLLVMFSFEAGRRCDSGPGNFTFETKQGNEIFGIVEAAIREQKAQAEEKHQSCPSLDLDCTAPQQNRSPTAEGSSDPDGDSGGSKPSSADGVFARRDGEGRNLKGRVLPDPPPPLTSTPPRSPLPRGPRSTLTLDDQSNLYSEPADSVRLPPSAVDGLYSDPVDSIKTPTPAPRGWSQGDEGTRHQGCKPDPLYSDIYDRVSVDLALRTGGLGLDARTRNGARQTEGARLEHIYDEPEGRGVSHGAGLYDEARLEPHAWRNRGLEEPFVGHEVPYNPNTDDYSVPAYNKPPLGPRGKGPKPLPAPKPTKGLVPRKEPPALPQGKLNTNVNNNNSGSSSDKHTDLYSQVSKHKHLSTTWYPKSNVHSPDVIYDNLGNI